MICNKDKCCFKGLWQVKIIMLILKILFALVNSKAHNLNNVNSCFMLCTSTGNINIINLTSGNIFLDVLITAAYLSFIHINLVVRRHTMHQQILCKHTPKMVTLVTSGHPNTLTCLWPFFPILIEPMGFLVGPVGQPISTMDKFHMKDLPWPMLSPIASLNQSVKFGWIELQTMCVTFCHSKLVKNWQKLEVRLELRPLGRHHVCTLTTRPPPTHWVLLNF